MVEKVRKDREEGGERTGLSGKDGWVLCEVCKGCACVYGNALISLYTLSRPTCCVGTDKPKHNLKPKPSSLFARCSCQACLS